MFDKINDPGTGVAYSINSDYGRSILQKYIITYNNLNMTGGRPARSRISDVTPDLTITSSPDPGPLTNVFEFLKNQTKQNGYCDKHLQNILHSLIESINESLLRGNAANISSQSNSIEKWQALKNTLTATTSGEEILNLAQKVQTYYDKIKIKSQPKKQKQPQQLAEDVSPVEISSYAKEVKESHMTPFVSAKPVATIAAPSQSESDESPSSDPFTTAAAAIALPSISPQASPVRINRNGSMISINQGPLVQPPAPLAPVPPNTHSSMPLHREGKSPFTAAAAIAFDTPSVAAVAPTAISASDTPSSVAVVAPGVTSASDTPSSVDVVAPVAAVALTQVPVQGSSALPAADQRDGTPGYYKTSSFTPYVHTSPLDDPQLRSEGSRSSSWEVFTPPHDRGHSSLRGAVGYSPTATPPREEAADWGGADGEVSVRYQVGTPILGDSRAVENVPSNTATIAAATPLPTGALQATREHSTPLAPISAQSGRSLWPSQPTHSNLFSTAASPVWSPSIAPSLPRSDTIRPGDNADQRPSLGVSFGGALNLYKQFNSVFNKYNDLQEKKNNLEVETENQTKLVDARARSAAKLGSSEYDQLDLIKSQDLLAKTQKNIADTDNELNTMSINLKEVTSRQMKAIIDGERYKRTKSERKIKITGGVFECTAVGEKNLNFKNVGLTYNDIAVSVHLILSSAYTMSFELKPKHGKDEAIIRPRTIMFPASFVEINFTKVLGKIKQPGEDIETPQEDTPMRTSSPDLDYINSMMGNIGKGYEYNPNRLFENFVYSLISNIDGLEKPTLGRIQPYIVRDNSEDKTLKIISPRLNTYHLTTRENEEALKSYFLLKLKFEGQWFDESVIDNISAVLFISKLPINYHPNNVNIGPAPDFTIKIPNALRNATTDTTKDTISIPAKVRTMLSHADLGLSTGWGCAIL